MSNDCSNTMDNGGSLSIFPLPTTWTDTRDISRGQKTPGRTPSQVTSRTRPSAPMSRTRPSAPMSRTRPSAPMSRTRPSAPMSRTRPSATVSTRPSATVSTRPSATVSTRPSATVVTKKSIGDKTLSMRRNTINDMYNNSQYIDSNDKLPPNKPPVKFYVHFDCEEKEKDLCDDKSMKQFHNKWTKFIEKLLEELVKEYTGLPKIFTQQTEFVKKLVIDICVNSMIEFLEELNTKKNKKLIIFLKSLIIAGISNNKKEKSWKIIITSSILKYEISAISGIRSFDNLIIGEISQLTIKKFKTEFLS